MSRHILSLSDEQLTAYDLDAFVAHAEVLNQHNRDTFTTPFPNLICDHGVYPNLTSGAPRSFCQNRVLFCIS